MQQCTAGITHSCQGRCCNLFAGTAAYVAAGTYGKELLEGGSLSLEGAGWKVSRWLPLGWRPALAGRFVSQRPGTSMGCRRQDPASTSLLLTPAHAAAQPLPQAAVALSVTLLAVGYIGRLATKAMAEYEAEEADKHDS